MCTADSMGSVGADFRCPWCGRDASNAGYALDEVGYPICCGEKVDKKARARSCLTRLLDDGLDLLGVRYLQLNWILCVGRRGQYSMVLGQRDVMTILVTFLA